MNKKVSKGSGNTGVPGETPKSPAAAGRKKTVVERIPMGPINTSAGSGNDRAAVSSLPVASPGAGERAKLLPPAGEFSSYSRSKSGGSVCGGLCFAAGMGVAIYFIVKAFSGSHKPNLQFQFKTPYAGGGTIIISNKGDKDVKIEDIQFRINGVINTTKEGVIYGDLAPWGKTTIEAEKTDGIWTTYTIKEPSGDDSVVLKAGETSNCTYVFDSAKGVLDVGVMPKGVDVTIDGKSHKLELAGQCKGEACDDPVPGWHLGGYLPNWAIYEEGFKVEDIPVDKINHIYYAFIGYDQAGNIFSLDYNSDNIQLPMLMQLKKQHPYLNVMLSIGGATKSGDFSALASNPIARENFAKNLVDALDLFGFSGIDIDWENPTHDEADNFIALLKTIRQIIDASGKQYKLTIAAPAGKQNIDAIGNKWQQVAESLHAINLMGYDYSGSWSEKSDYQSPVALPPNDPNGQENSLDSTLAYYQQYNVPAAKINLGMPAYFRGVKVADMQNDGMWQTVTGTPEGQFDKTGVFNYRCAMEGHCEAGNKLPKDAVYLSVGEAPYSNFSKTPMFKSDSEKAIFTGDSVESVREKSTLVKENGYQGAFFWAFSGDVRNNDNNSLIAQAHQVLTAKEAVGVGAPTSEGSELDLTFKYAEKSEFSKAQTSSASRLQSTVLDLGSAILLWRVLGKMLDNTCQSFSSWYCAEKKEAFSFDKEACKEELSALEIGANAVHHLDENYHKVFCCWQIEDLKDDLEVIQDQESLEEWQEDLKYVGESIAHFSRSYRQKSGYDRTSNYLFRSEAPVSERVNQCAQRLLDNVSPDAMLVGELRLR